MNFAIDAYRDRGYNKEKFFELLTVIFEKWDYFALYFEDHTFSVYGLRRAIDKICKRDRELSPKQLDDMEDFEETDI